MTSCWLAFVILITGSALVHGLPRVVDLPDTKQITLTSVVPDIDGSRSRRSVDDFPTHISVDLSSDGLSAHLDLVQNPSITDDVPVFLKDQNKRTQKYRVHKKEKVAFYEDKARAAAIMVARNKSDNSDDAFKYFGTFFNGDKEYLVQPDVADNAYTISRMVNKLADNVVHPNLDSSKRRRDPLSAMKATNKTSQRRKRQEDVIAYEVEIFIVTDYSIYQYWYDQTSGETDRDIATIQLILQFYALVLDAINVRYESVQGAGYTISCVYAGIYIAITDAVEDNFIQPYLLDVGLTDRSGYDADAVIDAFEVWAETEIPPQYGAYDHAMLFSRHEMGRIIDGTFNPATSGYAYVSALCTVFSQSINEDMTITSATTPAHELGHSLGAEHDEYENACFEADSYIMAPSSGTSNDTTINVRQYSFSSCSINYFTTYINQLNSDGNNCMTSQASTYDTSDIIPYLEDLAGQIYNPDAQCERFQGAGSFMYRSYFANSFEDICAVLPCAKADDIIYSYYELAWEGTTCGVDKICQGGSCVETDSSVAYVSETCLFGDIPYDVPYSNPSLPCEDYLGSDATSYHCYSNNDRAMCCETCESIRQANIEFDNCDYGDRASFCATLAFNQCYLNEEACCKSCPERALNIPDCKYGDKSGQCVKELHCDTPSNIEICCETCYEPPTSTTTTTPTTTTTDPTTTTTTDPTTTTTTDPTTTTTTDPTTTTTTDPTTTTTTDPTTTTTTDPTTTTTTDPTTTTTTDPTTTTTTDPTTTTTTDPTTTTTTDPTTTTTTDQTTTTTTDPTTTTTTDPTTTTTTDPTTTTTTDPTTTTTTDPTTTTTTDPTTTTTTDPTTTTTTDPTTTTTTDPTTTTTTDPTTTTTTDPTTTTTTDPTTTTTTDPTTTTTTDPATTTTTYPTTTTTTDPTTTTTTDPTTTTTTTADPTTTTTTTDPTTTTTITDTTTTTTDPTTTTTTDPTTTTTTIDTTTTTTDPTTTTTTTPTTTTTTTDPTTTTTTDPTTTTTTDPTTTTTTDPTSTTTTDPTTTTTTDPTTTTTTDPTTTTTTDPTTTTTTDPTTTTTTDPTTTTTTDPTTTTTTDPTTTTTTDPTTTTTTTADPTTTTTTTDPTTTTTITDTTTTTTTDSTTTTTTDPTTTTTTDPTTTTTTTDPTTTTTITDPTTTTTTDSTTTTSTSTTTTTTTPTTTTTTPTMTTTTPTTTTTTTPTTTTTTTPTTTTTTTPTTTTTTTPTTTTTTTPTTTTTTRPTATITVSVTIVFQINLNRPIDDGVINEVLVTLTLYYQRRMGTKFFRLININVRIGSIIAEYDVEILDDTEYEESASLLTKANIDLVKAEETVTLLNETVSASSVTVNEVTVTNETIDSLDTCKLFESITVCNPDYHCSATEGTPSCVLDSKQYALAEIVAAACAAAILLFVIVVIVCLVARRYRLKSRKRKPESFTSNTTESRYDARYDWPHNNSGMNLYGDVVRRHEEPYSYLPYSGEAIQSSSKRTSSNGHRDNRFSKKPKSTSSDHKTRHVYDNQALEYDKILAASYIEPYDRR